MYGGLERVTLPEPLQEEVDAQEEAIMPTSVLAHYILVLSHKMLGQMRHAERAVIELMGEVGTVSCHRADGGGGYCQQTELLGKIGTSGYQRADDGGGSC